MELNRLGAPLSQLNEGLAPRLFLGGRISQGWGEVRGRKSRHQVSSAHEDVVRKQMYHIQREQHPSCNVAHARSHAHTHTHAHMHTRTHNTTHAHFCMQYTDVPFHYQMLAKLIDIVFKTPVDNKQKPESG